MAKPIPDSITVDIVPRLAGEKMEVTHLTVGPNDSVIFKVKGPEQAAALAGGLRELNPPYPWIVIDDSVEVAAKVTHVSEERDCWCWACDQARSLATAQRMNICPDCGYKRCPRATSHLEDCDE